jgi:hypothetical protein
MKKIFVVALGIALCFTFAASASAIDSSSLENRTTEGLYDRNDAFDLARDAALLYQVQPLHLWTVGSAYSTSPWGTVKDDGVYNDESQSFLVGVARQLGPGSFAVFFETNKDEWETSELYTQWFREESAPSDAPGNPFWQGAFNAENEWPNYDGVDDVLRDTSWNYYGQYERTEYNVGLAYSMDFNDWISLGLSYEPNIIDEEETIDFNPRGLTFDRSPMDDSPIEALFFNNGSWFYNGSTSVPACWLNSGGPINSGLNYGGAFSSLFYADVEHTAWVGFEGSSAFTGKRNLDRREHPFDLRSHIRPNDTWDVVVGVGYANIDQEDNVTGSYVSHWEAYGESTEDGTDWFPWDEGTFTFSSDVTFTLGGALDTDYAYSSWSPTNADNGMESNYDGDRWSLYVSPTYYLNDMHSLRLDAGYSSENGDFASGLNGRLDYAYNITTDINGEETDADRGRGQYEYDVNWTGYEIWNGQCNDGDYENTAWFVEPRWYVNFDRVRFSAGLGWYYNEQTWSGTMLMNKTSHYEFSDGNADYAPPDSGGDYTFDGSYDGRNYFNGEIETTTWRAPVAVEFDITEKLTARVGAAYNRTTREERRTDSQVIRDNETYEIRDANGQLVEVGFKELFNQAPTDPDQIGTAYDQVDFGCAYEVNDKSTYDWTSYNLGLGYYFTENLQFDLMFSGNSGWVDSSTLFGSFTIIFP